MAVSLYTVWNSTHDYGENIGSTAVVALYCVIHGQAIDTHEALGEGTSLVLQSIVPKFHHLYHCECS